MNKKTTHADNGFGMHQLLGLWQAPDPAPDFEAGIWRKLNETLVQAPSPSCESWLHMLLPQTVWVPVLALVLVIVAGAVLGTLAGRETQRRSIAQPLLQPHTLTGAYLAMNAGGM